MNVRPSGCAHVKGDGRPVRIGQDRALVLPAIHDARRHGIAGGYIQGSQHSRRRVVIEAGVIEHAGAVEEPNVIRRIG